MTTHYYDDAFKDGEFLRPDTRFREWIRRDGSTRFRPDAGRYHLYVSAACPWSQRTMITRAIRGLEDVIPMTVTNPVWNEQGWTFDSPEPVNGAKNVVDLYLLADPGFSEDETVPILWDKMSKTIVCNESREIMRMFDEEFSDFGRRDATLYPPRLRTEIDETINALYRPVNNGVYRAGFARTQRAYERAARELFEALDGWEKTLSGRRYLCGNTITEADACFYVTLIRFDFVYYSHFKRNLRRIQDYPNLWGYLRDLYQTPGFRETTDIDHIKRHYYGSQLDLNPSGIHPLGPVIDLEQPHGREQLSEIVMLRHHHQ